VRLLTEYIDGPGLTVVIGSAHPDPTLRQFSLVASTYSDGDVTGTVGLIGPLRMQYSRAIPMVDHVAETVARLLNHGVRPPHPADS
jgi:heat-inducible transcriptional repressor